MEQGPGRRGLARARRRRRHPAAASRRDNADATTANGFQPAGADRHPGAAAASGRPTRRNRANKALRTRDRAGPAGRPDLRLRRARRRPRPRRRPSRWAAGPTRKVTWDNRINLTLGYDSTQPNGRDIATQIRSRLEDTGGLSVRLRRRRAGRPDPRRPQGLDRDRRWPGCSPTSTPRCRRRADAVAATETAYRATTTDDAADAAAGDPAGAGGGRPRGAARSASPTSTSTSAPAPSMRATLLRPGLAARPVRDLPWLSRADGAAPAVPSGRADRPAAGGGADHPDRQQEPPALGAAGRGRALPHHQGRRRATTS